MAGISSIPDQSLEHNLTFYYDLELMRFLLWESFDCTAGGGCCRSLAPYSVSYSLDAVLGDLGPDAQQQNKPPFPASQERVATPHETKERGINDFPSDS
jgi:hypothetical protein